MLKCHKCSFKHGLSRDIAGSFRLWGMCEHIEGDTAKVQTNLHPVLFTSNFSIQFNTHSVRRAKT
jgi:hypothetical protein